MPDATALLSTGLAFFLLAAAPGPATLSNAVIAMGHGRRAGLLYGAGLTLGLAFWGVIAACGLGAILQGSVYLLTGLKIAGALYLFWLAFQSLRSATAPATTPASTSGSGNWFLRGVVLNASNPKAVVAWMAALSMGLQAEAGVLALVVATSLCTLIGFGVYAVYSVVFSFGSVMRFYAACRRGIEWTMAGLLGVFGFGLLRSALAEEAPTR